MKDSEQLRFICHILSIYHNSKADFFRNLVLKKLFLVWCDKQDVPKAIYWTVVEKKHPNVKMYENYCAFRNKDLYFICNKKQKQTNCKSFGIYSKKLNVEQKIVFFKSYLFRKYHAVKVPKTSQLCFFKCFSVLSFFYISIVKLQKWTHCI